MTSGLQQGEDASSRASGMRALQYGQHLPPENTCTSHTLLGQPRCSKFERRTASSCCLHFMAAVKETLLIRPEVCVSKASRQVASKAATIHCTMHRLHLKAENHPFANALTNACHSTPAQGRANSSLYTNHSKPPPSQMIMSTHPH